MSWQEDLQQLDTALAGGQISADDYRRRRDEVLAKASGGAPGQGAQVPPAQPMGQPAGQPTGQPTGQPSTPPPGIPQQQAPAPSQGYFPPPFRWQTTPPPQPQQPSEAGNSAEETQTMRPVGQSDAERTQVVPSQGDRTQVVQGRPGDRTQVVPGSPNSGGFAAQYYTQQPDGPSWQGQESTPWGGSEFPPLGAAGNWGLKQGPEIFETGGGGKSRWIIAIVAAVVVLALIGGGIWWFTSGNKGSAQAGTTPTTTHRPPPTSTTPAGPKQPLAGLPGRQDPGASGPTTVQMSLQKQMFAPSEASLMADCGATDGVTQTLFQDTWLTQVHVFTCSSATAAMTAAQALLAKQGGFGYRQIAGPNGLPTMYADHLTDVPNVPVDERTFYNNGTTLVRIEVRGHDQAAANQGLAESVTAVDTNYPGK